MIYLWLNILIPFGLKTIIKLPSTWWSAFRSEVFLLKIEHVKKHCFVYSSVKLLTYNKPKFIRFIAKLP